MALSSLTLPCGPPFLSYQVLVGHGAESPQQDADDGHVVVPRRHMQTRVPHLQTTTMTAR